ncbi:MAG: hypothetical protein OWQ52_02060 [Metallosphaera prunae]|nr:hypothetical protein [Metallosphaera prunae]MCY0861191.1 hypothetical protein [Metallosphaera prunae]
MRKVKEDMKGLRDHVDKRFDKRDYMNKGFDTRRGHVNDRVEVLRECPE